MLAVMLLNQHRVSSSKTVRPRAPCGARCIGHAVSTWSAVCSKAPHSQFGERARPHLCMDEWNRPTPVRRWLSLTQAARGKPIPTGLAPVAGTKARSLEAFSHYSVFHLSSSSPSFEGHPLQARHKQDWGRGFIPLLPQNAALPESDAGSGVIKPASTFVIQNRQASCSIWCPMYGARC